MRADGGGGGGHVARAVAVDQRRLRLGGLGPSTSVHAAQLITASGWTSRHGEPHGVGVGDVEVGARERDDVMSGGGSRDDIRAEHARGPRDEKAHGHNQ